MILRPCYGGAQAAYARELSLSSDVLMTLRTSEKEKKKELFAMILVIKQRCKGGEFGVRLDVERVKLGVPTACRTSLRASS